MRRRRRRLLCWLAASLPALALASARGQAPPDRLGAPPAAAAAPRHSLRFAATPVLLLRYPAVQEELKLTPDQRARLDRVVAGFDRKRADFAAGLRRQPEVGRLDPDALRASILAMRSQNEDALVAVLTPGQRTRLRQILLQMEGPFAIARPEVAAELDLDPEQLEEVQAIAARYERDAGQLVAAQLAHRNAAPLRPTPAAKPGDRATAAAKPAEPPAAEKDEAAMEAERERLHAGAVRQLARILSRQQRRQFNALLGKPFDMAGLRAVAPGVDDQNPQLEPIPAGGPGRKSGPGREAARGQAGQSTGTPTDRPADGAGGSRPESRGDERPRHGP